MDSGNEDKGLKQVSFGRLIKSDLVSSIYSAMILLPWLCNVSIMMITFVVTVANRNVVGPEYGKLCLRLSSSALAGSLICCLLLILRLRFVQSLYSFGEEVTGKITDSFTFLNALSIQYAYTFKGKEYKRSDVLPFKAQNKNLLQAGSEVSLIVDPANPKQAVIRDPLLIKD